jgi:hypothetical protein
MSRLSIKYGSLDVSQTYEPLRLFTGIALLLLLTDDSAYIVQTGSGVHPTFYPIGTGGYFPESKATGA